MSTSSIYSFFRALKAAFGYHWNLLYLGTSAAVGIISGKPGVVLPLAAAVEILYLSILAAHPRFQRAVEAGERADKETDSKSNPTVLRSADQILKEISSEDQGRFERLRGLCQQLRLISKGLTAGEPPGESSIDTLQLTNLNRLLWIYLKMLYSKTCLEHFFRTINDTEIKSGLQNTLKRIQTLGPEHEDDEKEAKHRRSLIDMRQTLEGRLNNYHNTRENYDFLQLELERLYSKISGIVEMGISRQDPASVSTEIDVVSSSLMQTEKTIHELESITGFTFADEKPPILLKSQKPIAIS